MPRCAGGQDRDDEDHQRQGRHRGAQNDECKLCWLDPEEIEERLDRIYRRSRYDKMIEAFYIIPIQCDQIWRNFAH